MRGTTQIDSLTVTHQEVSGAIAQLGERLPCTQEVSGSIPLSSTILSKVGILHQRDQKEVCFYKQASFWFLQPERSLTR